MGETLLTLHDVADHFKVDTKTVRRLRIEDPDFPRPITIRGAERWTRADIEEWEKLQKLKARLEGQERTLGDSSGQSGTSAHPTVFPPSRRANPK